MEINTLAVVVSLALLTIGPGSGVYIAIRYGEKSAEETKEIMRGILKELRTLNHRVTKSEAHIEGLERREDE